MPRRRWFGYVLGNNPKSRKVSGNNLWSCSHVRYINPDNLLLDLSQDCSRIPCQELLVQVDLADNVDRPLDSLRVPWPFLASLLCRQSWLQFCLRHVVVVRNISARHLTLGDCVYPLRDQLFYLYSRGCLRQVHHLDWRFGLLRLYSPWLVPLVPQQPKLLEVLLVHVLRVF